MNPQGGTAAVQGFSQVFDALAFDQVGLHNDAWRALQLVHHALQPVQLLIVLARLCWFHMAGTQVEDLASPMALNGGGPTLLVN